MTFHNASADRDVQSENTPTTLSRLPQGLYFIMLIKCEYPLPSSTIEIKIMTSRGSSMITCCLGVVLGRHFSIASKNVELETQ